MQTFKPDLGHTQPAENQLIPSVECWLPAIQWDSPHAPRTHKALERNLHGIRSAQCTQQPQAALLTAALVQSCWARSGEGKVPAGKGFAPCFPGTALEQKAGGAAHFRMTDLVKLPLQLLGRSLRCTSHPCVLGTSESHQALHAFPASASAPGVQK